jgi:pimeloyl-ACP methyl ester carboxylesterase
MVQPQVIALHCSGGNAAQWQSLKSVLASRASVWCPHFIGSTWAGHWGGSHAFSLADEAASIVSMIDALGRPVHLVGHSYGAAVALRVARERPSQIASMVLYEPTALHVLKSAGPQGAEMLAEINVIAAAIGRAVLMGDCRSAAKLFVDYWNQPGTWDRLREEVQADVIYYMPKASLDFRALAIERTQLAVYRNFRFPVLLLQGEHTHDPMRLIARKLAKALRFCSLRTVEDAGHMGPLTHAETVSALTAAFIDQQEAVDEIDNDVGTECVGAVQIKATAVTAGLADL